MADPNDRKAGDPQHLTDDRCWSIGTRDRSTWSALPRGDVQSAVDGDSDIGRRIEIVHQDPWGAPIRRIKGDLATEPQVAAVARRGVRIEQIDRSGEELGVIGRQLDHKDVAHIVDGDIDHGGEARDLITDSTGARIDSHHLGVTGDERDETAVTRLGHSREERHQDVAVARIDRKAGRHRLLPAGEDAECDDVTSIASVECDLDQLVERALSRVDAELIRGQTDSGHVAAP